MANFSSKTAQVVLFLYCLTQIQIVCGKDNDIKLTRRTEPKTAKNKDGFFAIIVDDDGEMCGAVWISGSCLLTAASCLDKGGTINLPKMENSLIKIKVEQAVQSKGVYKIGAGKNKQIGVAIAHPLYKRVDGMTIAYDLAVVRVNFDKEFQKKHKVGTLCKKDGPESKLIALSFSDKNIVTEWELEKNTDKDKAFVDNHDYREGINDMRNPIEGVEYFIDHRKQFSAHLNISAERIRQGDSGVFSEQIFTTFAYGGPVLDTKKARCIMGIMNFAAVKTGKYYITSTKVTPVINWIEYTKNYLRNFTGQNRLTRLYGRAGMKFWKLRGVNPDPIVPAQPQGITPGEPVDKKAKESQEGKPDKPLRQINWDTIIKEPKIPASKTVNNKATA